MLLFSHDWLARKCFLPRKKVLEFSTISGSFFFFHKFHNFPPKYHFSGWSFHKFFTFSCYNRDKSFNIFTYTKRPTFAVDSNCLLDDTFTVLGTFSRRSKMVFRTSRHPYRKILTGIYLWCTPTKQGTSRTCLFWDMDNCSWQRGEKWIIWQFFYFFNFRLIFKHFPTKHSTFSAACQTQNCRIGNFKGPFLKITLPEKPLKVFYTNEHISKSGRNMNLILVSH